MPSISISVLALALIRRSALRPYRLKDLIEVFTDQRGASSVRIVPRRVNADQVVVRPRLKRHDSQQLLSIAQRPLDEYGLNYSALVHSLSQSRISRNGANTLITAPAQEGGR